MRRWRKRAERAVEALRPGLVAYARLLEPSPDAAELLADDALARTLARAKPRATDAEIEVAGRREIVTRFLRGHRRERGSGVAGMEGLSPVERACVVAHALDELSAADIAAVTGLDVSRVHGALERALPHLGATYEPEGDTIIVSIHRGKAA